MDAGSLNNINLVDCGERGDIKIDEATLQTKTLGLFAAGDVRTGKYKQIVLAAADGAKAALFVNEYLKKLKWTPTP